MFAGDGFGPAGPVADGTPPFTVAGPADVALDASRRGTGSFTVANVTARPVRARVFALPVAGADAGWFRIADAEISLPSAGTAAVPVEIAVPQDAAAGPRSFQLGVALEEAPDQVVQGPTVAFEVPEAPRRRFPWWIVIVAAVALLLLVGGGFLVWQLTRPPDPPPTDTATAEPTAEPRPVFNAASFRFQTGWTDVDLDTGMVTAGIRSGADLSLSDADMVITAPEGYPLTIYGYVGGVAVVQEGDFETCRDVALSEWVEVRDGSAPTFVCTFTSDSRIAMLEITSLPGEHSIREIAFTVWE